MKSLEIGLPQLTIHLETPTELDDTSFFDFEKDPNLYHHHHHHHQIDISKIENYFLKYKQI